MSDQPSTMTITRGEFGSATLTWSDNPGARVVLAGDITIRPADGGKLRLLSELSDAEVREYWITEVRPPLVREILKGNA